MLVSALLVFTIINMPAVVPWAPSQLVLCSCEVFVGYDIFFYHIFTSLLFFVHCLNGLTTVPCSAWLFVMVDCIYKVAISKQ